MSVQNNQGTASAISVKKGRRQSYKSSMNDFYKSFFEHNFLPMWAYDPSTFKFMFANDAAVSSYGYTQDEFVNKFIHEIRMIRHVGVIVDDFGGAKNNTVLREMHQLKNGKLIEVEVISQEMTIAGKPVCIETLKEITGEKKKEQLQKILYEISKAADGAPTLADLYHSVHILLKNVMVAENCWVALYTQAEHRVHFPYFMDKNISPPEPRVNAKELEEYVIGTQQSLLCTERIYSDLADAGFVTQKNYFTKVWLGVPLIIQKTCVGVLVVHDYSSEYTYGKAEQEILEYVALQVGNAIERRLAVLAIQEHESNLTALLENTQDAIWSVDKTLTIVTCNKAAMYIFSKLSSLEMKEGISFIQSLPVTIVSVWEEYFARAMRDEHFVIEYTLREGTPVSELEIAFNPISNKKGLIDGVSVFAKDITTRKRVQEEQKRAESAILESESRFRILAETVAACIFIYMGEKFIYTNPATEALLGYSKEELYQMNFWDVVHPDHKDMIRVRGLARQKGEDVPSRYEMKVMTKQGEERWIDFSAAAVSYHGISAALGTAFDITSRKHAEHLQTAVYRIAQAAEGATDLEELFPSVHRIISEVMPANNFYIALFDELNDVVSFPYFVDEEDPIPEPRKSKKGLTEYVIRSGKSLLSTVDIHHHLSQTGLIDTIGAMSLIWLGVPLTIERKTIGVMVVQHYTDAKAYGETEQHMLEFVSTQIAKAIDKKRTDDLLRSNEKRYRTLIENSSDVVVLLDKQGVVLYESPVITKVLGFTPEERIGQLSFSTTHPDDTEYTKHLFTELLNEKGKVVVGEIRAKHKNGNYRWLEVVGMNFLHDPNINAIVVNYRDINERKESEVALRDSEERFRSLFESATDAIFTLSLTGVITSLNHAFEKITGWKCEDWLGKSISGILHEDDVTIATRAFQQTLRGKQPPAYEIRVRTKTGEFIIGEFTSTPQVQNGEIVGVLGIARDITERKKLEDQIRYIQKMESIGILAGGVAHDFNNILTIIGAYAGSMKRLKDVPVQVTHNIEIIEKTVKRGARIVQQLLTLAKKLDSVFSDVTIHPVVEELTKLLHETFPKTITFDINVKDGDVVITADSNQLYQVLLNLCLNARDAMPSGGTLFIGSEIHPLLEVQTTFPEASAKEYLTLTVTDNGMGMDDEIKSHIFEPFFTTKEKGKGTGLGLSVVYGIIQNHKGFVSVSSKQGEGTTFNIYLPLPEEKKNIPDVFEREINSPLTGSETLLLVEDEESLLELLADVLKSYGYKILKAKDGIEAIEVFQKHQNTIRLVLSDLGLPKLGGFEAFMEMKKINPYIKVILASGYRDSRVFDEMMIAGAKDFVQKPYNVTEIVKRIRDVLDEK